MEGKFDSSLELIKIESELEPKNSLIYHYTSPVGMLGIMRTGGQEKLWFTQYDSLNDRSERENMFEFLHEYCDYQVKANNISSSFCDLVKSVTLDDQVLFIEMDRENPNHAYAYRDAFHTYLCCFSKNPDSLAMWNYYSKSKHYEGYAIGMWRYKFPTGTTSGYKLSFKNVIYTNHEKVEILNRLILPMNKEYEVAKKEQRQEFVMRIQEICDTLQLVFKDFCFAHEEEIRAILEVPRRYAQTGVDGYGSSSSKIISERKYREKDGYIIPYVELLLPDTCTQEIIVAPLLEKELSLRNLKDMLINYGYPHIVVKPSQIPIRY